MCTHEKSSTKIKIMNMSTTPTSSLCPCVITASSAPCSIPSTSPRGLWAIIDVFLVTIDSFACSGISYKWNHAVCTFFCLASLFRKKILRFMHIVIISIVHIFISMQYCIVLLYHNFLFNHFVGGHLSCFLFMAATNKAAMNILAGVFFWIYIFISLSVYLGWEWADHMKVCIHF